MTISRNIPYNIDININIRSFGSIPARGNEIFYLNLYFHLFTLVSRKKGGIEFCHSTRNASRIRQKVRNGVS